MHYEEHFSVKYSHFTVKRIVNKYVIDVVILKILLEYILLLLRYAFVFLTINWEIYFHFDEKLSAKMCVE